LGSIDGTACHTSLLMELGGSLQANTIQALRILFQQQKEAVTCAFKFGMDLGRLGDTSQTKYDTEAQSRFAVMNRPQNQKMALKP
jgi:hypothetical protein